MGKRKKAVVAGHICMDITPVFPKTTKRRLDELFVPGKLVQTEGVRVNLGGCVANTGLAMKLLGADVRLAGKIGNDAFGKLVLENLREYDAAQDMIVSEGSDTSYSIVVSVPGTDRFFLHTSGANDTFTYDDLDGALLEEAALFHLGYPSIMRRLYQNEGAALCETLRKVKEKGAAVSLDMAAIDPTSEAGRADWKKILAKALPYVDFFVPSVEELCFMIDRERYDRWSAEAGGGDMTAILSYEEIRPLAETVIQMGAKMVLIKCGAAGMYYRTGTKADLADVCRQLCLPLDSWAEKEGFEASFEPEAVLSGTGAGDTSIAAFLTTILKEGTLKDAVQMAAATGACCVASYDALSGLKPLDELKGKIEHGWKKQDMLRKGK